jgi:hypothetical protein
MWMQRAFRYCLQVATLPTGEIDYAQLEEQLRMNVARPAIINVNIGTTVRGFRASTAHHHWQAVTAGGCACRPAALQAPCSQELSSSMPGAAASCDGTSSAAMMSVVTMCIAGAGRSGRPGQGAADPGGHGVHRGPLLHPLRRRAVRPHGERICRHVTQLHQENHLMSRRCHEARHMSLGSSAQQCFRASCR